MKIRTKIVISLSLFIAISIGLFMQSFTIDGSTNDEISVTNDSLYTTTADTYGSEYLEPEVSQTAFGNFENQSLKGMQRNLTLDDKVINLSYSYTFNDNDIAVENRHSVYGTQDVFVDESGVEYYYLYNTGKFLGFINPLENRGKISGNTSVDQNTAVDVAREYLSKFVENFDDYVYTETVFQNVGNAYDVRFNYYLNGVKTDDTARAWITPDGGILSAYCFNMGKYSNYQNKNLIIESSSALYTNSSNDITIQSYSSITHEQHIDDVYITTDDEGNLFLNTFTCDGTVEGHKEETIPIKVN